MIQLERYLPLLTIEACTVLSSSVNSSTCNIFLRAIGKLIIIWLKRQSFAQCQLTRKCWWFGNRIALCPTNVASNCPARHWPEMSKNTNRKMTENVYFPSKRTFSTEQRIAIGGKCIASWESWYFSDRYNGIEIVSPISINVTWYEMSVDCMKSKQNLDFPKLSQQIWLWITSEWVRMARKYLFSTKMANTVPISGNPS